MDELRQIDPARAGEIRMACAGLDYPVTGENLRLASREECETTFAIIARTQEALDALQSQVDLIGAGGQPVGS